MPRGDDFTFEVKPQLGSLCVFYSKVCRPFLLKLVQTRVLHVLPFSRKESRTALTALSSVLLHKLQVL